MSFIDFTAHIRHICILKIFSKGASDKRVWNIFLIACPIFLFVARRVTHCWEWPEKKQPVTALLLFQHTHRQFLKQLDQAQWSFC